MRKQALPHFRTTALIEDNQKATNSQNYRYRLSAETLEMIRSLEGHKADAAIKRFATYHEKLIEIYASKNEMTKMPVNNNNEKFTFSVGKHNELQRAIIEEFAPSFAPNAECLYVGDTIEKDLVKNIKKLKELGFEMTKNVTAGKIYVTAFQSFTVFKKFLDSLAWETEVWISDLPDHMIHLNGDRFMGPR